jgi:GNAT superfamily N-acetyltransferase
MRVVRARPEDAATLTAVAFAAKRAWGYPESWIRAWSPTLTIAPSAVARFPTFLVVEGEEVLGFCMVSLSGREARIEHLWVRPAHWGHGVGRALFRHGEAAAKAAGAAVLVMESDPHAEGFYVAMGAVRVGSVPAAMEGVERVLPVLEKGIA